MIDDFISVIILNYNGKAFLKDCLSTISYQSARNYEIILVDNNSSDDSISFVKNNFLHVKIVECGKNYGFAKGNNIGVEYAKGRYVLLLNNDTKVDYDFVETLYMAIKSNPKYGLASALPYGIESLLSSPKKDGMSILGYCLSQVLDTAPKPFFISGFAFIFDREKIPIPFDDDYFLFYEDNYTSWLNQLKGYDVIYILKPTLWHYGSGTAGRRSRLKVFFGERNRIMNLLLFYSSDTLVKLLPLILMNMIASPLRALLVYRRETYMGEYLKGYLWVLTHFGTVMEKRRKIQIQRRISDEEIVKYFSYKITDGKYSKVLNAIAKLYCIMVGIRTFGLQ